ncbi:hypothetical protein PAJ34TS1_33260 [Paenibacillus azoreducens]|uniref:Uncharacterized protein n=1 Tax=Paenibacillus azoreducens TaxID=116718 RepID=A0A919YG86_9BACL|nr:hypothetical protein J34TS1_33850 [Paenibacillus azoreducens]
MTAMVGSNWLLVLGEICTFTTVYSPFIIAVTYMYMNYKSMLNGPNKPEVYGNFKIFSVV